ncbi:hypothetical protein, partial [Mycolicibacterium holsaticum]|uniref:hypothetical protein n=1 Tax=Mycolicibacterium holsaticum TaxID=152142 RepID=UPI00197CABD8
MPVRNRIEIIESWFAALPLGAIAVPVNFRLVAGGDFEDVIAGAGEDPPGDVADVSDRGPGRDP